MARFRFPLEAVLRQREREERDQQVVVASLERLRLELEGEIRSRQASITEEQRALSGLLAGGGVVDLGLARVQANASLRQIALTQQAAMRLAGLHKKIDAERLELLRRATRRRAVELLKERRHEAWRLEQNKTEQGLLDEMSRLADDEPGFSGVGAPGAPPDHGEGAA